MAAASGPNTVTDGLILCLDAGNVDSYGGTGAAWNNLVSNNFPVTLSASPTYSTANSGILTFNGSTQYASSPANSNFNFTVSAVDFTVEAWVNPSANASTKAIVGNWGQGGVNVSDSWLLWSSNGTLAFSWSPFSTSTAFLTAGSIPLSSWTHVAVTRSGNTFTIYVNGVATASSTNSATSSSSYALEIGRYGSNAAAYWQGSISMVKIYRGRALTASELLLNYSVTTSRYNVAAVQSYVLSSLIMFYDFGDPSSYAGSGTTVNDLSGNGLTATLVNSPSYSSSNGGYINFSGTSYATVTNSLIGAIGTGDYTIDLWIYWPGGTGYGHIYSMSSQGTYFFKHYNGGLYDGYAQGSAGGGGNLVSGQWRHVVVSRTSGTSVFYVNASQVYTRANSFNLNQTTLNIRSDGGMGEWVQLYIALPKLYRKGLSAAEVTQNFNVHKARFGF